MPGADYQHVVVAVFLQQRLDDLERALQNRSADDAWANGIELVARKFQNILESEGVKKIDALGKEFDPNFHEAITQEPAEGVESGPIRGAGLGGPPGRAGPGSAGRRERLTPHVFTATLAGGSTPIHRHEVHHAVSPHRSGISSSRPAGVSLVRPDVYPELRWRLPRHPPGIDRRCDDRGV